MIACEKLRPRQHPTTALTPLSFLYFKSICNKTSFPIYADVPGTESQGRERRDSFLPYCASKEWIKGI